MSTHTRPETMQEDDVIDLLLRQHAMIRDLFAEVQESTGEARQEAFTRLVRLLAVHETAEEEVVHPYARRVQQGGEQIVEDRLREERAAKELLSLMDERGAGDPEFLENLDRLRIAVTEHARAEERYEFVQLRAHTSKKDRQRMAAAVKAASALAPTHPHPGVESATKNLLVGTPTAMMDRVRDIIQKVTGKD